MIARNIFSMIFTLTALFMIGGCSDTPPQPVQKHSPNIWRANNGEAEIFFYAVYDNPADEPSFPETFRFSVDGGYVGEIDKDRFIETKLSPGDYLLSVDEIDWGGNVTNRPTLPKQVRAGDVLFIAAHFPANQKPFLTNVNEEQGIKDTGLRKRIDPCESLTSLCRALF